MSLPAAPPDARIIYVGHATVLIELNGVQLLTDPILRNRIGVLRRHAQVDFDPAAYRSVEAVLISHLHHDHLDLPSLRRLGQEKRLIAPRGTAGWLRALGFRAVEELQVGETTQVGSVAITATYAVHDPARHRFGRRADACLGYLVQGSHSVYFPGDTDLFPAMAELCSELDLALLPVWGWGPTLGPGHLDPGRAAQALTLLRPRLAVPIHWGVLHPVGLSLFRPGFLTQPPLAFAALAAQLAPDVQVEILPPGGSLTLPKPRR
jgi:L-ascorbate metabolism protein UlaG (beta-lactamase superfamily)